MLRKETNNHRLIVCEVHSSVHYATRGSRPVYYDNFGRGRTNTADHMANQVQAPKERDRPDERLARARFTRMARSVGGFYARSDTHTVRCTEWCRSSFKMPG